MVGGFNGTGDLFTPDPRKLAHREDPGTSHAAARRAVESGLVSRDALLAHGAVLSWPGSTVPELAERLSYKRGEAGFTSETLRQKIGRRMKELETAGLIVRGPSRDGFTTWLPALKAEA